MGRNNRNNNSAAAPTNTAAASPALSATATSPAAAPATAPAEQPPFDADVDGETAGDVNEDGSPAGSAFDQEGTEGQGHEGTEVGGVSKPGPDGKADTIASEAGKDVVGNVNNGTGDDAKAKADADAKAKADADAKAKADADAKAKADADAKAKADADAKANAPRPMTRREEITARIAEIERDGGPIGRTLRLNDQVNDFRILRDKKVAEWDKELAEMRGQVRKLQQVQQDELEEVRLLTIELAKLAD